MDGRVGWMLVMLVAACGGGERASQSSPPAVVEPSVVGVPVEDPGGIPRCGSPENASELTDFGGIEAGTERWVAVNYRGSRTGWMPAEPIEMPMHHATRLDWTNLDDFEPLSGAHYERLRFSFEVLGREMESRGGNPPVVRVEISARVTQVCSLSADASRSEGALLAAIGTDTSACDQLTQTAVAAAAALAACAADADCAIIEVPTCDLEGVGCYWHAANRNRSPDALSAAIRAVENGGCPAADCDCPTPPTSARCVDGRCQAR